MEAIPNTGGHRNGSPNVRSHSEAYLGLVGRHYVHRLWQTGDIPQEDARVQMVDLLAHAGLLVPEGIALSTEAHREFLEGSGILEDLHASPSGGGEDAGSRAIRIRISHRSSTIDGELNREICQALIGLGAPSVAVVSGGLIKRGLKSIPEVKDAVKEAWLSLEGLKRQLEAVSRGEEVPTWPVSILAEDAAQ